VCRATNWFLTLKNNNDDDGAYQSRCGVNYAGRWFLAVEEIIYGENVLNLSEQINLKLA